MRNKKLIFGLTILAIFALLLSACSPNEAADPTEAPAVATEVLEEPTDVPPEPTEEPAPEMPAVGSMEHPIKMMFVPSVDQESIITGADLLVAALNEATGLYFEVTVPASYAATIEEMCASPDDTMAFIPGLGYVLANQLCGVQLGGKAERFGYTFYTAIVIVQRDSDLTELSDLNGLKWAYPDASSTSGYLYPTAAFLEAGVVPGESFAAGGHSNTVRAVYSGEADFGTVFYSPPRVDGVSVDWAPPSFDDVPADLLESCATTEDGGKLLCGNFEIRDARRNIRKDVADAAQTLRILYSTPYIPNDTFSFGPDFDADMLDAIVQAMFDFAANDPDGFATALDFYSWTNAVSATDAEYDPIREGVAAVGFSLEDLSGD